MNKKIKKLFVLFIAIIHVYTANAQVNTTDTLKERNNSTFKIRSLIAPTLLIGYGVAGFESKQIKNINTDIRKYVVTHVDTKIKIDNVSQFVPTVSVYVLNICGIKGKNDLARRSILLASSYLITNASVFSLKYSTGVLRPDSSTYNSFPSGHTANAFVGAEFLWQEYKDVSVWYGVAGYVVATATGALRIYNNRHWLTDVAAGAGIGILSTKLVYWVNSYIDKKILTKQKNGSVMFFPSYDRKQLSGNVCIVF